MLLDPEWACTGASSCIGSSYSRSNDLIMTPEPLQMIEVGPWGRKSIKLYRLLGYCKSLRISVVGLVDEFGFVIAHTGMTR